ncbi:MAG: PKD-like domain-containing protein, partial [Flavobacteriia bacterium]
MKIYTLLLVLVCGIQVISSSHAQVLSLNGAALTASGGAPSNCTAGGYKTLNSANVSGNCVTFTTGTFQNGAIWACSGINLNQSFKLNFTINFGNVTTTGDGMAFLLQAEGPTGVIGGAGGGLGYAQGNGTSCQGAPCPISPSVAVEFDTWNNIPDGLNDLVCDHSSIQTNGVMTTGNTLSGPVCMVSGGTTVKDGLDHAVCITWDPAINRYTVFFDGVQLMQYNGNIRTLFADPTNVYWGFTGASGGSAQTQRICSATMLTNIASPSCSCSPPTATATPNPQTICSGNGVGVALTSNIVGSTFTWSTTANTSITGESTTSQSGATITDVLTNTTASPVTLNYTVTPTAAGCAGTPLVVPVTVNPTPVITATPNPQTICSGASVGVNLTSNVTGTTFTWGTTANGSVTGESTTAQSGASITDALTNTTTAPVNLTYTVNASAGGCPAVAVNVPVTVNPTPVITATPNPQTICSGASVGVNLTSNVTGTTFTWITTANGSVTGESTTAQSGASITDALTNTTTSPVNLTYTVNASAAGCPAVAVNVPVTVNPTPVVTATPNPQTICSGNATGVALSSNVAGTTFAWSTVANGSVTGETTAGGSGASISDVLTNTTSSPVTVTYSVIPTASACAGLPINVPVTINPIPTFTTSFTNPLACGASNGSITLSGLSASTGYSLSYSDDGTLVGPLSITSTAAGTYVISGLNAGGYSNITIAFGGCNSLPAAVSLSDPSSPVFSVSLLTNPTTCGGTQGSILIEGTGTLSPSTVYSLTYTDNGTGVGPINITTDANGDYTITGLNAGSYTAFVLNLAGCTGSQPGPVTLVDPALPVATAGTTTPVICDGSAINLTGNTVGGATYSWTGPNLFTSNIEDPSIASATTAASGTYTLTITLNNCLSLPSPVNVTVNATPVLSVANPASVCSPATVSITAPAVTTGSTNVGTLSYWTDAGATSPLTTPSAVTTSGTYYIQANNAGCIDIAPVTVTVVITPDVVTNNPAAVCSPSTVDLTAAIVTAGSSNLGALTYWTDAAATSPLGTPGAVATSGTYFIQSGISGCTDIEPVVVTINQTPNLVITDPTAVCSPSTVNITAPAVTAGSTNANSLTYWNDAAATSSLAAPSTISVSNTYYIQATNAGCTDIAPVVVTINQTPNLVITNPAAVCTPATVDLTAAAVTAGSTNPGTLTYWTDGGASIALGTPNAVTTGGTYYIQANNSGCFDVEAVLVTINQTPNIVVNNPAAVCTPATVDITVGAVTVGSTNASTLTYWIDAGATAGLAGPNAIAIGGTYYIQATNAGCTDIAPVLVTVNQTPDLVVNNPAAVCTPATVDLTLAAVTAGSTNSASLTYWTNATATTSLSSSNAVAIGGTYYIQATNAGCTDIAPVTVTVNQTPNLVITDPAAVCTPATVDLTAVSVTSGSSNVVALSYWTDLAATSALANAGSVNTSGTYYIQASNAGCTDIAAVTATINTTPTLIITDPAAVCTPATVDLTAASVTAGSSNTGTLTYWTDASATSALATPAAVSVTNTYYIQADNSGCVVILPVDVTVNQTPTLVITNPAAVCTPGTVNLTASAVTAGSTNVGSLSYWSDAAASNTLASPASVSVSNTYYIQATNAGCTSIQPVVATINATPTFTLVGTDPSLCNLSDGSITISGLVASTNYTVGYSDGGSPVAAASYTSTAGGTITISGLNAGAYNNFSVTITSSGCTGTNATTVTLINPGAPVITDLADQTVCDTYTLPAIIITGVATTQGYYTAPNGGGVQLAVGSSVTSPQTIYIYAINGTCTDEETVLITVNNTPAITVTDPAAVCTPATVDITAAAVTAGSTNLGTMTFWSDAAATTAVTTPSAITTSGMYYIQSANGACTDIQPVNVTVNQTPVLAITNPSAVCSPATVDITAAAVTSGSTNATNLTYWNDAAATSSLATPSAIGSSNTYYIQSTNAGCTDIAPVVVVVNVTPGEPTAGTDSTYCSSWDLVNMTVSGTGGTYTWYTDASLNSVHGTGSGIAPLESLGTVIYYVT